MNIYEIIKDRFNKLMDLITAAGFGENVHPEGSKIRLEEVIVNGKSQYVFNLKKEASLLTSGEKSLERNDVFVPTMWGVFLAIVDANGVETLYPYAPVADGTNPSVHKAGFLTTAIRKLYSGFLTWNIDSNVLLSSYPMEKFEKVPQVQGAFLLNSSDAAVNMGVQSEFDIEKQMSLVIPRYTIAGTRDHKIAINFDAAGLTFPVTSGYTAKLVFMMDGFLVKGGCEYKGGAGTNPFGEAVGQW